jgi:hypothetical protein
MNKELEWMERYLENTIDRLKIESYAIDKQIELLRKFQDDLERCKQNQEIIRKQKRRSKSAPASSYQGNS